MTPRSIAHAIIQGAMDTADAGACLRRHLSLDGSRLQFGSRSVDLDRVGRVRIVGAGKAAGAMAEAVEAVLGRHIDGGLVLVPHGATHELTRIEAWAAAHPLPDAEGIVGSHALLELLSEGRANDLVLVLLTGGASSLLVLPAEGLSLRDLQQTHQALLDSGADIHDINTLRKHLSAVKGGWLSAHVHPATAFVAVLSDVVGDDPAVIGSGPMSADPTDAHDAIGIIERYGLRLPSTVLSHLHRSLYDASLDTPKSGNPWFSRVHTEVVGSSKDALAGAKKAAERLGLSTEIVSRSLTGEARHVGSTLGRRAVELADAGGSSCLLFAGETTVRIEGDVGVGGRNQELALAAAVEMAGERPACLFSIGTDGADGPTSVAGAIVDHHTVARLEEAGIDPHQALGLHDSHTALAAIGATHALPRHRTNVADVLGILTLAR